MAAASTDAARVAGRPRRPALNEAAIAQAALAIIDADGWPACTMRALAERLGVRAPSLYHHVNSQDAIVDLVRGLIIQEIYNPSIAQLPWDEAIRRFAIDYYRAFKLHPNTIPVLITAPVRDTMTLRMYEVFLRTLTNAGWSGPRAFEVLLGIEHLALGFALEHSASDTLLDLSRCEEAGASVLGRILAERTEDQAQATDSAFLHLLEDFIQVFRSDEKASASPAQSPG